ncbi:MAG TPA: hypothetical protein PKY05_18215 [Fibrobacteria bacterium]|nr:hypothetical protein [Fibrobacteria bacterium]
MLDKMCHERGVRFRANASAFVASVLIALGLPCSASDFEGFSWTVGTGIGYGIESFGSSLYPDNPRLAANPGMTSKYEPDELGLLGLGASMDLAWNFESHYIAVSGFGTQSMSREQDGEIALVARDGKYSTSSMPTAETSVRSYGGVLEFGFTRSAIHWIYSRSGRDAGTTYSSPRFHAGIGGGMAVLQTLSTLKAIEDSYETWLVQLRLQRLIGESMGFDGSVRILVPFESAVQDRFSAQVHVGLFYKIL